MIPFNRPYMTGNELTLIEKAHMNSKLAGDGPFTRLCHEWLERKTGTKKVLLTHSCTAPSKWPRSSPRFYRATR